MPHQETLAKVLCIVTGISLAVIVQFDVEQMVA